MTEPFKPKQYHDEFRASCGSSSRAKQRGKSIEIGKSGADPDHRHDDRPQMGASSGYEKEKDQWKGEESSGEQYTKS
jgi:hypothetical protein